MYAWIWRHLPYGMPGKITGSLLLAGVAVALLWYVIFPWLDPFVEQTLLPWNDSQLDGDFAPTGGDPAPGPAPGAPSAPGVGESVGPDGEPLPDEHEIPYETDG